MASMTDFISQSQRIIAVSTRPRRKDFERIAKVTMIGMILMGIMGVIISLAFLVI
jgi:protein transport protein SEC61 subunit gamma-like protein